MNNQEFKPLYLAYACKDLLMNCYTKSDIKNIGDYSSSFPTHEAVDSQRTKIKPRVDAVFSKFKECVNEHQMRKVLKTQPIDVKFFVFERFVVTLTFMNHNDIEAINIESSKPVGLAFVEAIETLWQQVIDSIEKQGYSISELSSRMIQTYG